MATPDAHNKKPRHADDNNASDGEGTVNTPLDGETLDHPVLDGSSEDYGQEGADQNPHHGMDDPALIRKPETGKKTQAPWG